jgi:hypothetical protein
VNEVELVFYGQRDELESSVLQKIGVVHFRPPTDGLFGFFAVEKRYGSEIRKPLTSDILGDHSDADWIIYRYLSLEEERAVRDNKLNKKIYVILHNYYSFQHLYEGLLKENMNQYSLIVDRFNPEIKSIHDINPVIKTKNYLNISKPKVVVKKEGEKTSFDFSLRVMLTALARILLNPINELNRYSILMRYSQARVLIRLLELISFILFLLTWCFHRGLGLTKVASIKGWFLARHVTLMSAFKFYGVAVDTLAFLYRFFRLGVLTPVYYWLGGFLWKHLVGGVLFAYRIFKLYIFTPVYFGLGGWLLKNAGVPLSNFVKFSVRHLIVIAAAKFYGVFVDISLFLYRIIKLYFLVPLFIDLTGWLWRRFVPVLNFFKFNVRHILIVVSAKTYGFIYDLMMWCDRWIRLPVQNFFKFTVRHFLLMMAFKTYGLVVDTLLFIHRISKLYLMYPLFKIYWFASFQYKKRIKKYFV